MPELTWGRYETLRPGQIDAIRANAPIAYLPWGALEWHSYHNPVGLDGIKAHGICLALAEQTGGVVLPPVYVGTDTIKPFKGFKHTIDHPRETVEALATQFLEQLADEDFRVIVLLTGHYGGGHVEAINAAAEAFRASHPDVGLWALPDSEPLDGVFPANHAAHGETSFQLLFAPGYVDLSLLPSDRAATLDDDGVWGDDPREATAEAGEEMLRLFVARAVPRIQDLLKEHAS